MLAEREEGALLAFWVGLWVGWWREYIVTGLCGFSCFFPLSVGHPPTLANVL